MFWVIRARHAGQGSRSGLQAQSTRCLVTFTVSLWRSIESSTDTFLASAFMCAILRTL